MNMTSGPNIERASFAVQDEGCRLLDAINAAIELDRRRRQQFGNSLATEPWWTIMLQLYAADLEDRDVTVPHLMAADLSSKLILRWIDAIVHNGLALTVSSPAGTHLKLTAAGKSRMEAMFAG
jgi:hypothetical protein